MRTSVTEDRCGNASRLAPEKRQQILRAALEVFFELGFERATVDLIAGRAGVSKATVYNHFQDKGALFVASVLAEQEAMQPLFDSLVPSPHGSLADDLRALGMGLARLMLSPTVSTLHKVLGAEVGRFPDLGRALYERSTTRFQDALARFFAERIDRGELEAVSPAMLAQQFPALCLSELHVRVALGLQQCVSEEEIQVAVDQAATTVLRAYGRGQPPAPPPHSRGGA